MFSNFIPNYEKTMRKEDQPNFFFLFSFPFLPFPFSFFSFLLFTLGWLSFANQFFFQPLPFPFSWLFIAKTWSVSPELQLPANMASTAAAWVHAEGGVSVGRWCAIARKTAAYMGLCCHAINKALACSWRCAKDGLLLVHCWWRMGVFLVCMGTWVGSTIVANKLETCWQLW